MKKIRVRLFTAIQFMFALIFFVLISMLTSCTDEPQPDSMPSSSADKGKVSSFDAPTVSCVEATQTSITVKVTAGATGAPAGFSLQWTTKEILDANNGVWPSDEALFCKAGFSGNAYGYVFNLSAGESSTVQIGDILFDTPGASSSCVADLLCGTQYVFRAFAHATSTMFKSGWSAYQTCSTDACEENCVYGQGYWKTHGPEFCNPSGGQNLWPVTSLTLGTVTYTDAQLCTIFNTPPSGGNGLVSMAHQLIAAKLNIANGADGSSIQSTINAADALIGGLVVPSVGTGYLSASSTSALTTQLDNYNSGRGAVSYCTSSGD